MSKGVDDPAPHIEYVTLREHFEALREADQRALQIKDKADEEALALAREIQAYKDEKANELREQINNERGVYVERREFEEFRQRYVDAHVALEDKFDAQLKPINDYITGREGRSAGSTDIRAWVVFAIAILIAGQAFWATH